jgi:hypothetical protein
MDGQSLLTTTGSAIFSPMRWYRYYFYILTDTDCPALTYRVSVKNIQTISLIAFLIEVKK